MTMTAQPQPTRLDRMATLPPWGREMVALYESNAANQFILYGNINDRMLLPIEGAPELGTLSDFLLRVLLPQFDVILSYDPGNGIRVEKGEKTFSQWPYFRENPLLPKAPYDAIQVLTHYFRYTGNLARLNGERTHVAAVLRAANLSVPGFEGGLSYELNAMALLARDWATDSLMTEQPLATFFLTENLNDLHPQLVNNNRAAKIQIPLPAVGELEKGLAHLAPRHPRALPADGVSLAAIAQQMTGAQLASIEGMLKTKEYAGEALTPADLVQLKKKLVENDSNGLIEFIESTNTLDDLEGMVKIKKWLRQDIELWRNNRLEAMPMGYLLCGPVGTGKTFLVRCLAGEAGVPVVKIKNFRDKWVGSSEGNLEKIFRILQALGRCFVFVDEADQALGRRESGSGDSGVSGRIYSMIAEEMSNTRNRGRIVWILASSRPDLIEVDLKRPGRVDVKIPIFPTSDARESFDLIRALCRRRKVEIPETTFGPLEKMMPSLLTPGAAEALAVKIYRQTCTGGGTPAEVLADCLRDYQNPVTPEVMQFQIGLAVNEASDLEFVPERFRKHRTTGPAPAA